MDLPRPLLPLESLLAPKELSLIERAYQVAAKAHQEQLRRHGAPYIDHPVGVTRILFEILKEKRPEVLAAALLHDTLEDTTETVSSLSHSFPKRTVELVELLTNPPPPLTPEERRVHYQKILQDLDGTLLKIADRIHNLQDLLYLSDPSFIRHILKRTQKELLFESSPIYKLPQAAFALEEAFGAANAHLVRLAEEQTLKS